MTTQAPVTQMTSQQREDFERDGYLIVKGALDESETQYYRNALDAVYERQKAAGELSADGALHQLSAVESCPEMAGLLNHPKTFPLVWSMIGWNIYAFHSHLDVHPPEEPKPFRFLWHQDGGKQNSDMESDPRPRLSVKLAYWLSDVSQTGRGNIKIVPGSHLANRIEGPPSRDVEWPDPEGAIEVQAEPGDALFFDRRLWHARSENYSDITRKVVFIGYTQRWIFPREELVDAPSQPWWAGLDDVQKQLLGGLRESGDNHWGLEPKAVPLYNWLGERDLLDQSIPVLRG